MKMYVDLFKSKEDKTTCTVSYDGRMVMYHGKDIPYYVNKILEEAKNCDEIFVDTRGLSGCLYDCLKKADNQNRVKELSILKENEKDNIDKIFEILNLDKNKMPIFQEVIRQFGIKWKKFNEDEKFLCTKILSGEFKKEMLHGIENDFKLENKTLEVDMTPEKMKDGICATVKLKRDIGKDLKSKQNSNSERKLEEIFIHEEEHSIENGVVTLNNIPLKDSNVYIEFENNKLVETVKTNNDKTAIVTMPEKYRDYTGTVYCTYKIKDWADVETYGDDSI